MAEIRDSDFNIILMNYVLQVCLAGHLDTNILCTQTFTEDVFIVSSLVYIAH